MNRRGFMQTCLALAMAPAIVRAQNLMPIVVRRWPLYALPADIMVTAMKAIGTADESMLGQVHLRCGAYIASWRYNEFGGSMAWFARFGEGILVRGTPVLDCPQHSDVWLSYEHNRRQGVAHYRNGEMVWCGDVERGG